MMRRFLRNYTVQTNSKLVKENTDGSETVILDNVDPMMGPEVAAAYSDVAKNFITHAAVVVGTTYCVCKIVGRICK